MDNGRLERVLIIKPSSLGDIIHALPVASSIKSALPGVGIDWVAGRGYAELLEGNPAVDRVIIFDRGMLDGPGKSGRLRFFLRELRRERYSLVIDLQGLLRSALMALACRSPLRVGFDNAREGATLFYNVKVPVANPRMHAVDRYLLVPEHMGIKGEDTGFAIKLKPEHDAEALRILREAGVPEGGAFVAMAPSARWETKRWEAAGFVEVANRLYAEKGIKSVFVGAASDARVLDGAGEGLAQKDARAFGRTSIKSLAALFKRAGAVLTNDSGPMHLAAAVGTATVAMFGPTDPGLTGPYGDGHRVLATGEDCSPCFRRSCPDVRCLSGITPDEVYEAVTEILERGF